MYDPIGRDRRKRQRSGGGLPAAWKTRVGDASDRVIGWRQRVQDRLHTLRRAQQEYRARLAPDFSVFTRYIQPDENRLSLVLADLLDPDGDHGQGQLFLREFLDRFW